MAIKLPVFSEKKKKKDPPNSEIGTWDDDVPQPMCEDDLWSPLEGHSPFLC